MPFESLSSTSETSSMHSELATPRTTPSPTYRPTEDMSYHYNGFQAHQSASSGWNSSASSPYHSSYAYTPPAPEPPRKNPLKSLRERIRGPNRKSGVSLIPYDPEVHQAEYFRGSKVGGRILARGASPYGLPCDRIEQERLGAQHNMIRLALGGNYFGPLHQALGGHVQRGANPKRVLDIGTGTGAWAIQIADEYPNTEVIGLDMVPIQPRSVPPNCRFEVYDINDGLPFADASLDVVHLRFAHSGVISMTHLISEITRTLRPSGYFFSLSSPSFLLNLHPPQSPSSSLFTGRPQHPAMAELSSIKRLREVYELALRAKRGKLGAEETDLAVAGFLGAGESGEGVGRVIKVGGGRLRVGGEGKVGLVLGACSGEDRTYLYPLVQRNFQAQVQAARVVILEYTDLSPRAFDELERNILLDLQRYKVYQS